jgi:signal peptidase I
MSRAAAKAAGRPRSGAATKSGPPKHSATREWVESLLWAAVLAFLLQALVVKSFRIPSGSMLDTLQIGDYLFVNKFLYGPRLPFSHVRLPGIRPPRRGDVIVFDYPPDPSQQFIKRCIGTPGDTVEIRHKQVLVNGRALVEPYVMHVDPREEPAGPSPRDNFGPFVVPPGKYFMMGDNRDNSADSRYWGYVDKSLMHGPAMFLYFSTAGEHWWDAPFKLRLGRFFRLVH